MGKKPIVKIRVYRGSELNYDENKKIKNENHIVSLIHGTRQWDLFMKNLPLSGYCKVSVEKAFNDKGNSEYDEIKDISHFENEVKSFFTLDKPVVLTPDQQRIQELSAKLDAFLSQGSLPNANDSDLKNTANGNGPGENVEVPTETQSPPLESLSLDKLQLVYEDVVGSKPHHMKKEATLIQEINEAKASK